MKGKLSGESRLTGTVQTGDQHNGRIALYIDVRCLRAHKGREFIPHYLDHQLLGLHCREDVRSQRLFLHRIAEILGHLVTDISIKKGLTDILHRLCDVDLGDFSFSLQYFE